MDLSKLLNSAEDLEAEMEMASVGIHPVEVLEGGVMVMLVAVRLEGEDEIAVVSKILNALKTKPVDSGNLNDKSI